MSPLRTIISRLKRFTPQWRLYGFSVAFWALAFPLYRLFGPFKAHFGSHKHRAILKYLYKNYAGILDAYSKKEMPCASQPASTIGPGSTIWVSWWDGADVMPPLVKACYISLLRHAGTHPVQLITKHNFRDFIFIPEYILERVNTGKMTVTHFSNILRVNLLHDYGGIWLDSTILVLQDILLKDLPFYTLKAPAKKGVSVSLNRFAGVSNLSVQPPDNTLLRISRWSGFLLAGTKGAPIFSYLRDILYAYWKEHEDQIDYLLFDYTIALGYDNIPFMKNMIDHVSCSEAEKFELEKNLNTELSDEIFAKYCLTPFHKLTWKKGFDIFTKDNKLTIYGYILNQFA